MNLTPSQIANLQTNLKAVHRFFKFNSGYDIIIAMAGSPDAAALLNTILSRIGDNVGSQGEIVLPHDGSAPGVLLSQLTACGVRNVLHSTFQQAYCWIEVDPFIVQLATVLKTGTPSARLLLQLPWTMDYDTYIRYSPQWAAQRLKRMIADRFTCKRCGATNCDLEVHHTTQEAYTHLGKEKDSELLTVCLPCHDALHGRNRGKARVARRQAVQS